MGCGDGFVQDGEECDDNNRIDDDGCSNACTENICGNLRVDPGEQCDDGLDSLFCNPGDCILPGCGDGFLQEGEQCDDGNQNDVDQCNNDCALNVCGDGIWQLLNGESCDDGNLSDADGCDATATLQTLALAHFQTTLIPVQPTLFMRTISSMDCDSN